MAQMWNAVKRRVAAVEGNVNQILENLSVGMEDDMVGASRVGGGLTASGAGASMRSPGRHHQQHAGAGLALDDGEGPLEEGYKAALVRFQLDQIKVTKEYQQLLGEKDAEVRVEAIRLIA